MTKTITTTSKQHCSQGSHLRLSTAALAIWTLVLAIDHQTAVAQAPMPPQMLPSLISQLTGRAPSSELLLQDFLAQEQRRARDNPAFAASAAAPRAPAQAKPAASAPVAGSAGAGLASSVPGSLESATPTFSQAIPNFRLDQYHPIEEIYSFLDQLARKYPKRVHVFTVGRTGENRPIKAVELINNATDADFVWLDALTHAREWITGTTILYTLDKLLKGDPQQAATGPARRQLIYAKNYIIVPVVNPDGYAYTWSTNRMWRKNRSKSESKCIGADLNRNFDHSFGGEGSSSDPCSHIYSGAHPFSEPETRSIADLMWSLRERIKFYLTMHSFNQLWACPYAHTTDRSAHLGQHMRVLRTIQQAVYQAEGVRYEVGPLSTSLYVGSGFGIDFAYDKCGIVNSYLVELRDRGTHGFVLPADQIMPTARETFAGLKAGLRTVFGA